MGKKRYPFFGFRLPEELVKELEEVAKHRSMTRQDAAIEAFKQWIDKQSF